MSETQYCSPIGYLHRIFNRAQERFVAREPSRDAQIVEEGKSGFCLERQRSFFESTMAGQRWKEMRCGYANVVNTSARYFIPVNLDGQPYEVRLEQTFGPPDRYQPTFISRRDGSYLTPVEYGMAIYRGEELLAKVSSNGCSRFAGWTPDVDPLPPSYDLLKKAAVDILYGYGNSNSLPVVAVPAKSDKR